MIRVESENITFSAVDLKDELENLRLRPVGERMVIKEIEALEYGILTIPGNSEEMRTMFGVVLACGEDARVFKAGDIVYFGRYAGALCEIDGRKYNIQNEEDIIGVIEEVGFAFKGVGTIISEMFDEAKDVATEKLKAIHKDEISDCHRGVPLPEGITTATRRLYE